MSDGIVSARLPRSNDLTGQRFGSLTVLGFSHASADGRGRRYWRCVCDCGNEAAIRGDSLKGGGTVSCGCALMKKLRTHGHAPIRKASPTYRSWNRMRARCLKPTATQWKHYGGRGITVCKRWESFENFLADMGERPSLKHSIDRIDNSGNYEPGNCRWATMQEQCNNRRSSRMIEYDGVTMSLADWARKVGIKYQLLLQRLNRGWSAQDALFGK
jgi:hypothetical protein